MALLVPNIGERELLERILNTTDNLQLHLFQVDHTPVETDVVSSYEEVSGGGYSKISLTSDWVISGDPTEGVYPQVNFEFTDSVSIYGYYITNENDTLLLWVERFNDGPYNIPSNGGSIKITPKIQLD